MGSRCLGTESTLAHAPPPYHAGKRADNNYIRVLHDYGVVLELLLHKQYSVSMGADGFVYPMLDGAQIYERAENRT